MSDQTAVFLYFLAPFALLWTAFAIAEGVKIAATVRAERRERRP